MIQRIKCLFGYHKDTMVSGVVERWITGALNTTLSTHTEREKGREATHVRIYAWQCSCCGRQRKTTKEEVDHDAQS